MAAAMLARKKHAGSHWPPSRRTGSSGTGPPGDPPDDDDDGADADDPDHVPLGDGADPPEREPARVLGVLEVEHVPDDGVQLVLVEHVVVEDRHLPRPRSDRLRDLHVVDTVQRGGEPPVAERTTDRRRAVAGRTVRPE